MDEDIYSDDYLGIEETDEYGDEEESSSFRRKYKKKKKKRLRIPIAKIAAVLVVLFLLTYFSMLIYTSNFTMLETELVDLYTLGDSVDAEAVILRSEEYITNSKKGIISYTVSDGEKVNAGGTIAVLFNTEQEVENRRRYNEISEELELLKQMTSSKEGLFVNLDTVDVQIKNSLIDFKNNTYQNRLADDESKLDLLRLFNERTVVTGGSANFEGRIAELESELEGISYSEGLGKVKTKKSGFFTSSLDGFENSLDFSKAEKLTVDDVNAMVKKDPPSNAVGKVVTTINWYLLCPLTSEQALTVTSGDSVVEVSIPRVMSGSIPATVVTVNQSSKTEGGLLVLKCDYMDSTLADVRRENVSIKTSVHQGLRVSRSAIHNDYVDIPQYDENGEPTGQTERRQVQGVYVLYGKRLTFVPVNIIYSDNEFVICSDDPSDPNLPTGKTIALHDTVVVRGKELYDGKIVR